MVSEAERAATERQLERSKQAAEEARRFAAQTVEQRRRELIRRGEETRRTREFIPIKDPTGKTVGFRTVGVITDPVTGLKQSIAPELMTARERATGLRDVPTPIDTRVSVPSDVLTKQRAAAAAQQLRQQFTRVKETREALPKQVPGVPTPTGKVTPVFTPPEVFKPKPRARDEFTIGVETKPFKPEAVGGEVLVERQQQFFKDIGLTGVVEQLESAGKFVSEVAGFEMFPTRPDPISELGKAVTQIPAAVAGIPIFVTTPLQVSVPSIIEEARTRPLQTGALFLLTPIALGKARGVFGKVPRPKIVTEPVKFPEFISKRLEGAEAVVFRPVTEGKFAGKVKIFRGTAALPSLRFVGIIESIPKPVKKLVLEKPERKFKVTRLKGVEDEIRLGATPKQSFVRVTRGRPTFETEIIKARKAPIAEQFELVTARESPFIVGRVFGAVKGEPFKTTIEPTAAVLSITDIKVPVKLPSKPKLTRVVPDVKEVAKRKALAEKEGRLLEPISFEELLTGIERLSTGAGRTRAREFARGRRAPTKKQTPEQLLRAEEPQRIKPLTKERPPIIEAEEIPAITPKTFSIVTGATTIAQEIQQRSKQLTEQARRPLQEQRPITKVIERQEIIQAAPPIVIQKQFQVQRKKLAPIQIIEEITTTRIKPPRTPTRLKPPGRTIISPLIFPRPTVRKKPKKLKRPRRRTIAGILGKVKAPKAVLAPKAVGLPDVVASFARRQEKVTPIGAVGAFRQTRNILVGKKPRARRIKL